MTELAAALEVVAALAEDPEAHPGSGLPTGTRAWANRGLDWSRARASRLLDAPKPLENSRGALTPIALRPTDRSSWWWGALIAVFAVGLAVAIYFVLQEPA